MRALLCGWPLKRSQNVDQSLFRTHPVIPAQAGIHLATGARLARGITAEPIPTASTQRKVDARLRGRDRGWA